MASLIIPISTYTLLVRPRQAIGKIINIAGALDAEGRSQTASFYFYDAERLPSDHGRLIRINPVSSVGPHATVFLPADSFSEMYHILQTEKPLSIYCAYENTHTPNATANLTFFQLFTQREGIGEGFEDPDMASELDVPS